MGKFVFLLFFISIVFFSSASAALPSRIIGGVFSNAFSTILKWLWSLIGSTRNVITGLPVMKYEDGYNVETVFDGSKLGIEPFSVEVSPNGELFVLDSANSNLYKVSSPLSSYSRPKLVAGSSQGYTGHVDGKAREASMNHPQGFTIDDSGNIYIADSMNMAIRKIRNAGVTTIGGGKWGRGGTLDLPNEEIMFSTDLDVVYVGSTCSLLVIDRGNQAIQEIQLQYEDCANQYGTSFSLGKYADCGVILDYVHCPDIRCMRLLILSPIPRIAMLLVAGFFGYMLASLQHRGGKNASSQRDPSSRKEYISPYQKPPKSFVPMEDMYNKQEGLVNSLGGLTQNTAALMVEIFGGLFGFGKKLPSRQPQNQYQKQQKRQNVWPLQESFEIPDDHVPLSVDVRTPIPKKTYAFMAKEPEKIHHVRQSRGNFSGQKQQQHYQQQSSSVPKTFYEETDESTTEIVFGTVQEHDECLLIIKPVDYGDPAYYNQNVCFRSYNMGNVHGY